MTSADFGVNGEDVDSWFEAIGADENVPEWVQAEVAKLFVQEVAKFADRAEIQKVKQVRRPGDYGVLIPKTKIYVRLRGIHKDAAVLAAGLLATLVSHGAMLPVLLPGGVGVWARVSMLTSDQRAMLAVMRHVAEQKSLSIYKSSIPQDDILAAWPTAEHQQGLRLLAELKEAGAITEIGSEWKAVL